MRAAPGLQTIGKEFPDLLFLASNVKAPKAEGLLRYLGSTDDVRPHIAAADAVVLPSYREGVPRTLLEAAAMGRPLITSDAAGCRDAVDPGVNGFLARVQDAADLAAQIARFASLGDSNRPAADRARFGELYAQGLAHEKAGDDLAAADLHS